MHILTELNLLGFTPCEVLKSPFINHCRVLLGALLHFVLQRSKGFQDVSQSRNEG
jgi:hypothetical protein